MAAITTRKPVEYMAPRNSAHTISPSATSPTPSGVARTASYTRAYFSL